jgi:excisionase family DNA binding protein
MAANDAARRDDGWDGGVSPMFVEAGKDEILTSRQARDLLKIGRTKLWELTKSKVIPAYRVGDGRTSSLRYKRSELLGWLESNRIRRI